MLTTQQKLDAALVAYHQLQTGSMPRVVVDQNGERVEFTAANSARLYSYILLLQSQLVPASIPPNGPAGFVF